ncbi:hypothetical protein HJC23_012602 [Cyclotella cryptica]|uniref:UBA domain-containing protein n=1 Tax=Cyclotella cryptica TaxID=29204 RepID=A0ABD3QM21_9STRA|eukprot:CCRYP_004133-RA/>CCRYP_004133-RA protein AED:0.01 eAED:-0.01 QI:0/-1/0/1/-1/1/1/0/293
MNESIAILESMGFDQSLCLDALNRFNGNLDRTIDFLLGGGGDTTNNNDSNAYHRQTTATRIIHSEISQYSDPKGRSACTSIALEMAGGVLDRLHRSSHSEASAEECIDSSFLSESIHNGLDIYAELQRSNSSGVEHLSVEEFLQMSAPLQKFQCLKLLPNSPRQGILSSSTDSPVGLESILSQCQSDVSTPSYVAVVITKPPETVLVVLPSLTSTATSTIEKNYALLDSHPRPNQLTPHNPSGSYAIFHSDLPSLVRSLKEIFPVVDLGSDVNEMMAMMYNSFDVYPFVYSSE